jgi:Autographiviridae endonuclease
MGLMVHPTKHANSKNIEYVKDTEGCWNVISHSLNRNGYSVFKVNQKMLLIHRYSYETNVGEIPEGMEVLHSCDNRRCINPKHLFLGTQADNNQDMKSKGRCCCGESHHNAKLKANEVSEIRRLFTKKVSLGEIANRFAISKSNACLIANRKAWRSSL